MINATVFYFIIMEVAVSVRPLDWVMTITQSQNLQKYDPTSITKLQQQYLLNEQNQKSKESVTKIPDNDHNTESMEPLKNGMQNNSQFSSQQSQQKFHSESHESIPEKAILDNNNGHSIDILG